jgi:hypothetical protein
MQLTHKEPFKVVLGIAVFVVVVALLISITEIGIPPYTEFISQNTINASILGNATKLQNWCWSTLNSTTYQQLRNRSLFVPSILYSCEVERIAGCGHLDYQIYIANFSQYVC